MAGLLKPAVVIIALLLLGTAAAVVLARPDPGDMITFSGADSGTSEVSIPSGLPAPAPLMDGAAPDNIETATFAMG
jgi:hypothetical protein